MRKIIIDPPKRQANLSKHGLDLEDVELFDWDTAVIGAAHADRFNRQRKKAVGRLLGLVVVVIYSELGSEAISVISLRVAGQKERKLLNDS